MTGVNTSRSRFGVGHILAFTALRLSCGCCFAPLAHLKYQWYRIDSFCESIVKGEPIADVSRRAQDEGFYVYDPQKLDPSFNSEVVGSTNFLLAHLLCSVKHDGQRVESARRSEPW